MRKLILPLLIIAFLCGNTRSFSQGTDCATPNFIDIASLTCTNFPLSTLVNQSSVLACTTPTNNTGRATWFQFISDGTCPMLSVDVSAGGKAEVSLYTDCATRVNASSVCLTNGSGTWSPVSGSLVNGNLYYLRIWTAATTGNIGLCNVPNVAQEIPLNNTCTDFHLSPTTDHIAGNISSAATCGGTAGKRVTWAKFHTTAANSCVTFNVNGVAPQTEVALYGNGGSCNATIRNNSSVCYNTDGIGVWSAGPSFPANLYTPNMDYYLRVYTNIAPGADQLMTLCGSQKTQAVNDVCTTAVGFKTTPPLPSNNACAHYTGLPEGIGDNTTATNHANYVCASSFQNMVWYKFKIATTGVRGEVSISGINCDSYNNSSTLLQMGLLTGNCGSLTPAITPALTGPFPTTNTSAAPTSCLATANASTVTLYTSSAVTKDQVVYLAIDGFSGANCKFNLQSIVGIIPIPIILKYFTAWKLPGSNLIRWVTSSEHLNNYFEVERSLDGTNFVPIGRVAGRGESTTDQVYDLEDKAPPALAYYRLKQVDFDEKFSYSEVIMLQRNDNVFFNASMPNPVGNNARITISTQDAGMVMLRIMDGAGRQVMNENISCNRGNTIVNKDLSRLASGNYFLLLTQDSKRIVKSFVKQ